MDAGYHVSPDFKFETKPTNALMVLLITMPIVPEINRLFTRALLSLCHYSVHKADTDVQPTQCIYRYDVQLRDQELATARNA
jgi:hypothetical protein